MDRQAVLPLVASGHSLNGVQECCPVSLEYLESMDAYVTLAWLVMHGLGQPCDSD